jgi:glucokinase
MILAADIGASKLHFGCYERLGECLVPLKKTVMPSKSFPSLDAAVREFLGPLCGPCAGKEIKAAVFGLPGPIANGAGRLTNLGWTVDADELRKTLPKGCRTVLINDLQAMGEGVFTLGDADIAWLGCPQTKNRLPSKAQPGTFAVIAPGTGLGETAVTDGAACASEGGHCDFAPTSEMQVRLWRYLAAQYGHVSFERILSGPGLVNLAGFFMQESGIETPENMLSPEEVTRQALNGDCPACKNALDTFSVVLGAEAGNLALKTMATSGVFIGGGIAPKILKKLSDGALLNAFCAKGRLSGLVSKISLGVILNEDTPLRAAAMQAARQAGWQIDGFAE